MLARRPKAGSCSRRRVSSFIFPVECLSGAGNFCWGEALYTMHSSVLHADWIKLNWQLLLLWGCEAEGLKPMSPSKVLLFPVRSVVQPPFRSSAPVRYSFTEQKPIDTGSEREHGRAFQTARGRIRKEPKLTSIVSLILILIFRIFLQIRTDSRS